MKKNQKPGTIYLSQRVLLFEALLRYLPLFFCLGATLIIHSGCSRTSAQKELVIAGSTSIQPFADKWAEVFMEIHPDFVINVQGGGSSAGIQATRSGAAQIGTSSRELKPEEKDLNEIEVARDGLAIIVHPSNAIDDMSIDQVRSIFSGKTRNWSQLGGQDKTIHVVTREEGSGTRGAFQELVMHKERIFKGSVVQDSNGAVREIVTYDQYSIGYISLGLVNEKVKPLKLEGVVPDDKNILNNQYKLVRPFLFVIKGLPTSEAKDFIDFVLSQEGQELIKNEGLIPARQKLLK